ncbi:MAG: hypothetical protein OFPII_13820 [Osedax symbiont Rs1]|nr:MAG: hypothetical protein OFPII_13820 [Osedax symbiont Rs1]
MILFCILLASLIFRLEVNQQKLQQSHINRYQSYLLADELRQSSDDLTRFARSYAVSGEPRFKQYYMDVLAIRNGEKARPLQYHRIYWDLLIGDEIKPRANGSPKPLLSLMMEAGFSEPELQMLEISKRNSDSLVLTELKAMNMLQEPHIEVNQPLDTAAIANHKVVLDDLFSVHYHQLKAQIMRPVDEFFDLLDSRTQSQVAGFTKIDSDIVNQLIALTIFLIIFSILLCLALFKFVLRPLGGEPAVMNQIALSIATGKLDIPFNDNAIGVYKSLKEMTLNLKQHSTERENRAWLQEGQVSIDQVLRKERKEAKISQLVLTTLARYIGASVGSLYVWRENISDNGEGALISSAVFAHTHNPDQPSHYKLHEGLVGQAAAELQQIIVQRIPSGYMRIHSATGEHQPVQIVLIPFSYMGRLRGVIELAFMQTITPLQTKLLESLRESIGITFENISARNNLHDALEEAQNLSEELQTQQEELRVSNESLRSKSKDLEQQQETLLLSKIELENKATQLEQSNQYKSEFLANMSHELRTPLNSLLILARSLQSNPSGNLSVEEVYSAQVIQDAGHHLLELINHILDSSKIEAGHMQVHYEQVDLRLLKKLFIDLIKPLAEEQLTSFKFEIATQVPQFINSDKLRLEQILINLISNAIKFTKQGQVTVSLNLDQQQQNILFCVADTGIGIAAELHQHIFQAFQQADGSMTRKYGGTGLGLSISKDLALLLGGDIELTSIPGQGSTFTLSLPLQARQQELASIPEKGLLDRENTPFKSTEISTADQDSKHILVVEDDLGGSIALQTLLKFDEVQVQFVTSGEAALQALESGCYLAVILDLNLPDISGFEVLETLASTHRAAQPEFIVYTARALSDDELIQLNQYTDKIIVKSSHSDERLLEEIHELILEKSQANATPNPLIESDEAIDTTQLQGKTVLLVDDDMRNTYSLAKILREGGLKVEIATSGAQGLTALDKNPEIDLVIMDMMMPGMDGYETTVKIREQATFKNLPIIVLTASALSGDRVKLQRAGANDFLSKPIDMKLLYESLIACV